MKLHYRTSEGFHEVIGDGRARYTFGFDIHYGGLYEARYLGHGAAGVYLSGGSIGKESIVIESEDSLGVPARLAFPLRFKAEAGWALRFRFVYPEGVTIAMALSTMPEPDEDRRSYRMMLVPERVHKAKPPPGRTNREGASLTRHVRNGTAEPSFYHARRVCQIRNPPRQHAAEGPRVPSVLGPLGAPGVVQVLSGRVRVLSSPWTKRRAAKTPSQ